MTTAGDAIGPRERVVGTAINSLVPAGIVVPVTQASIVATFLMTLVLTAVDGGRA